jgi:hypothetical protein
MKLRYYIVDQLFRQLEVIPRDGKRIGRMVDETVQSS